MADPKSTSRRSFTAQAEGARLRIQELIAEEAATAGDVPEGETKALSWAMLSGAITAVGNGFVGLIERGGQPLPTETMLQALHDQLDSAVRQARLMRTSAND